MPNWIGPIFTHIDKKYSSDRGIVASAIAKHGVKVLRRVQHDWSADTWMGKTGNLKRLVKMQIRCLKDDLAFKIATHPKSSKMKRYFNEIDSDDCDDHYPVMSEYLTEILKKRRLVE